MAEFATLARPYANAVFAIAKADARLTQWSEALHLLAALAAAAEVQQLLGSPTRSAGDKASALVGLCGDVADAKVERFLLELARNKRLDLLPEISAQFEALKAQEEMTLDVEVVSAYALDAAQQQKLADSLKRRFARDVRLATRTDASLVGGVLIKAGDTVIDGSVRGRLEKLTETVQRS